MQWLIKLLQNEDQTKLFKKLFLFSAFFHLMAVIFSAGFHRPDEHLGMMRFVSYSLGLYPLNEMSWEFPAMIRPWLQPVMYLASAKVFNFFGGENPFTMAFIFRFLSSAIGFYSLYLTAKMSLRFLSKKFNQNIMLFSLCTLWYLPFFHARTTAENFGISFFIFAIYPLIMAMPKDLLNSNSLKPKFEKHTWSVSWAMAFAIGIGFGASYIFRFQMAFMTFFVLLWYLLYSQIKFTNLISISLGVFTLIGLSSVLDFWGYGQWTFTTWNYFYQNIFKGVAAGFGVSPWYYYFNKTLIKGIPPLSLLLLIPTLWLWIRRPGHFLTWLTLPYFAIHSMVGHKELRFIFALGMFSPLILAYFIEHVSLDKFKNKKWMHVLLVLAIIQNFGALAISSSRPAYSPINFYKHIYNKEEVITKIYTLSVFRDQLKFYLKNPIEQIVIDQDKVFDINFNKKEVSWFLTNKYADILMFRTQYKNCTEDYLSYPNWVFKFNYKNWLKRSKIWALYRCE
jgi:phosphatidylinositol glycan class B